MNARRIRFFIPVFFSALFAATVLLVTQYSAQPQATIKVVIESPKHDGGLNVNEFPTVTGKVYGVFPSTPGLTVQVFNSQGHVWDGTKWSPGKWMVGVTLYNTGTPGVSAFSHMIGGARPPAGPNLPEGRYTVRAKLHITGGHLWEANIFFYIDRTPPTSSITSPTWTPIPGRAQHHTPEDPYISTDQSLPPIIGTATDNVSGIQRVEVWIVRLSDGLSWGGNRWDRYRSPLCGVPVSTTGGWSCTKPLPGGWNLTPGQYAIRVWAYDKAGNVGRAFINITAVLQEPVLNRGQEVPSTKMPRRKP